MSYPYSSLIDAQQAMLQGQDRVNLLSGMQQMQLGQATIWDPNRDAYRELVQYARSGTEIFRAKIPVDTPKKKEENSKMGGLEEQLKGAKAQKEQKVFSFYRSAKEFVTEHRSVIFTVVGLVLADKYLFNGALKDRIQKLVEALLAKAEALVGPPVAK